MRNFTRFVPLFAVAACGLGEQAPPVAETGPGYVVEGELPDGVDLEELVAQLPAGGFGIVADPGTGDVATLISTSSPLARVASSEFSVSTAAACDDCGDPTCASTSRTISIGLSHDSGINGETFTVQTSSSTNFSSPSTLPASWSVDVGNTINLSTTGTLPSCAPFGHFFDVIGPDAGTPVTVFTEDFDALPNTPTSVSPASDFDDTLPEWSFFNDNDSRRTGTGSSATGGMYSFGDAGSTERALGGLGSGTTGSNFFGFCVTNSSGEDWTDIELTYTGEQWREASTAAAHSTFVDVSTDYTLADLDAGELEGGTSWTNVGGLTFTGPLFGVTGARDGNDGANQVAVSGTLLAGPVADGSTFCVRFEDPDDSGSDHGLAIDDLTVTATEG